MPTPVFGVVGDDVSSAINGKFQLDDIFDDFLPSDSATPNLSSTSDGLKYDMEEETNDFSGSDDEDQSPRKVPRNHQRLMTEEQKVERR